MDDDHALRVAEQLLREGRCVEALDVLGRVTIPVVPDAGLTRRVLACHAAIWQALGAARDAA